MLKRHLLSAILFAAPFYMQAQTPLSSLPEWKATANKPQQDWLIHPSAEKANVFRSSDNKDIILSNGLTKRAFRLSPNIACTDYTNLVTGEQLLRAVKPEAVITLNDVNYNVGGLYGQKEKAYIQPQWVDGFTAHDSDFVYAYFTVKELQPYLNWKRNTWAYNQQQPTGKTLSFYFTSKLPALKGVTVAVQYEIYDGLPLICKSVSIENNGSGKIKINKVVNEVLAVVEEESAVVGSPAQMKKPHGLYIESNYAFNNSMRADISDQTTHWLPDPSYTSQVNYDYLTPCLLEIYPGVGPGVELETGDAFNSIRTFELLQDSYDRERNGLARKKMYSTIAPWTTQNPIFMHLVSKNDEQVRTAIDQCAATGYEALILSFGSHCDMEDSSARNVQHWKELADYAHSKGILIGGYSLFSSRRISDEDDVIDPKTGKPDAAAFFGHAPCLGSKWGLAYINKLKYFFANTGFNIFENDGPYPGDVCASTSHPGHTGLDDSQWKQMELQKELYHWCNERGIYINAPDWYFLDGTNKIALGYREVNFSLPREQQMILNRQNIYDGTWDKTPSMGWGFVPLTKYQGGGPEAVLEPLADHLPDYEKLMVQYYGSGVQACYRGPRLYDTDKTKALVQKTVNWYKKYRDIMNSDMVHLRRADGRDWDGMMHINPKLRQKAFVLVYNPLKTAITRTVNLPLYYTGLTKSAVVKEKDGSPKTFQLKRDFSIDVPVTIAAESYNWLIIE